METIIILGSRGFIGTHLQSVFPHAKTPDIDIADPRALGQMLDDLKPDVLINAAGKTGRPNVDWCEDHKHETIHSNVTGPLVLLEACAKRGVYWVHVGSGCIYQGDNGGKGFTEEDAPNFHGSFYARSKASIDQVLREFPVLQLRLRMPFDASDHPRNLINKLKRYDKVLDAKNSITYIPDFLKAAKALIGGRKTGIYNVVNPGALSPYDIMSRYKEIVDTSHSLSRLTLDDLSGVVKAGRSNCILSTQKLQAEGVSLMPLHQAVEEALRGMKASVSS